MVTLAIDTSTAATSVAIVDGDSVLAAAEHVDARRHAELLTPMIAELRSASADVPIDRVVCGVGPGAYTGLRVGIATAQGLGLAWGIPVLGICSLDVLAAEAVSLGITGAFIAASDARRREVYWAHYDAGGRRLDGPYVHAPAQITPEIRTLPWVGEGAHLHDLPDQPLPEIRFPRAQTLAHLADGLLAAGEQPVVPDLALARHGDDDGSTARSLGTARLLAAMPLYVRRPDAAEPGIAAPTGAP